MSENRETNGLIDGMRHLFSRIQSNMSSNNISIIGTNRLRSQWRRFDNCWLRSESSGLQSQNIESDVNQETNRRHECDVRPHISLHRQHSRFYRHSTHYPLLLGPHNCSLSGDNRVDTHSIDRDKDRNVLSAILSIIVIATLATALAQPKWFSITNGVCDRKYIGLQEFFYVGYNHNMNVHIKGVKTEPQSIQSVTDMNESEGQDMVLYGKLRNCVTPQIITLQRTIICLCFFAIVFNLIQFFFDTLGVNKKWLNGIRRHALGNILGVLLCVVIIGVSYLVSNLLEKEQKRLLKSKNLIPSQHSHHIEVKFELSYYLVTISGLLAIIAAASNLLKRPHHYYIDASDSFWSEDIDPNSSTIDDDMSSSATTSPNWHLDALNSINSSLPPNTSIPPPPYSP